MDEKITSTELEQRKRYTAPEIIYELELETRAGSPGGFPDDTNNSGMPEFFDIPSPGSGR